jgi:hypothetical protein
VDSQETWKRLGFRVQGSGFMVQGSEFRVQGSGFRVQGSGFRVQSLEFRVTSGKVESQEMSAPMSIGLETCGHPTRKYI